jgi:hypothetical protein
MSKTKITPLGFGAVLYEIEDNGVNFDEHGRIIRPKKTKPVRPRGKKTSHKRPRKSDRKA